jgi:hypothetical protein
MHAKFHRGLAAKQVTGVCELAQNFGSIASPIFVAVHESVSGPFLPFVVTYHSSVVGGLADLPPTSRM